MKTGTLRLHFSVRRDAWASTGHSCHSPCNLLLRLIHNDPRSGDLPPCTPAPVAGALAAGVLPFLERELRRAGERAARGGSLTAEPTVLQALLSDECHWWPTLGWLLSYSDVRQGAALMVTLRKMAVQAQGQQQQRRMRRPIQRNAPDEHTASTFVTPKTINILKFAVQVGRRAGAAEDGGYGTDSGGGTGRGGGGGRGSGGGGGSPAVPGGQVRSGDTDSPGLPRLQLLLWYGVRQLMPPLVQMAVGNEPHMGTSWSMRDERFCEAYTLMGNVLRPVAVLALQITSGGGGGSGRSSSGAAEDSRRGGSGGSPPAWLRSWGRVLLEEWRAVELVGSALEQIVPALGSGLVIVETYSTLQSLVVAVCSVALAFPDRVWSAAAASGAEAQGKEWQAKERQRGGGSSSSGSGKGGGKRAAPCVLPAGRVVQLLDAARGPRLNRMGPELDALSKLVDLVKAGGPELPYKYDMPFVQATMKLKINSDLLGGFRWLCRGEAPTPELLDGLLRTCSYPRCAGLEGDSEAGAKGRLAACGRGCGGARYCCQACAEVHWREGHAEACRGGAATEGQGVAGISGSSSVS